MTSAKPIAIGTVKVSLQHDHAEDRGHGRVDVGDDGRADRPDRVDEGAEQDERRGRADDRRGPRPRSARWPRASRSATGLPPIGMKTMAHEGQRDRHDPDRREAVEATGEDRRAQRVADDHDADLEQRRRVRGAEVGADDERHTGDADEHARAGPRDRIGRRRRSAARSRRRPAERRRSASPPASSRCAARPTRARPTGWRSRPPRRPRPSASGPGPGAGRCGASAIGSRMAAAMAVRPSTSVAGVISATAIRMNRYGMPQMTDIRANRISARRLTTPGPWACPKSRARPGPPSPTRGP